MTAPFVTTAVLLVRAAAVEHQPLQPLVARTLLAGVHRHQRLQRLRQHLWAVLVPPVEEAAGC